MIMKLLALDMDGTCLNSFSKITDTTMDALRLPGLPDWSWSRQPDGPSPVSLTSFVIPACSAMSSPQTVRTLWIWKSIKRCFSLSCLRIQPSLS